MSSERVTILIPSLNEQPYLEKTILNVLENAGGDIEVVVILDGWLPSPQIVIPNAQGKVIWVHHETPEGQRASVNEGARIASGKYVMKLDAHCSVGKDFDVILARDCEYDMTMIPAMFNLDVLTWLPREFDNWEKATRRGKLNPYMYIGWKDGHLRSLYYNSPKDRVRLYEQGKSKPIDETMTCMGPGFFMHRERFLELGGMDEGHGQWGQMGVEVACKAWLSGGKQVVNKKTWFAHLFRTGNFKGTGHNGSTFPYPLSGSDVEKARKHSRKLWIGNQWSKAIHPLEWLIDRFKPIPGWHEGAK
jgi:glycosyltransferase involved in cell wall biosynthesis